ncbi:MAK10-like protein [Tanacetum coccineum]
MASQDARLSKFEADFKKQQSEMTNKIDTVLKAITNRIAGTLPSDAVKNSKLSASPVFSRSLAHAPIYNGILDKYIKSLELGKNGSAFVQGEVPAKMEDPRLFALPCRLGDSKSFDTLADLGSCVNIIPLYLFKKLNIGLLEETDHIFGLADGTKSYPVGIVKDVEVYIGKLKLLNDFYVIDKKKEPKTPLLVGRGFLVTANADIDCKMAKIVVGEGITRLVFKVKGVDLGKEEAPYWTTLGKRDSYKPPPSSDEIGAQNPYYARKDFLDCHLPREWQTARDVELNPFKDTLVFKRMVIIDKKKLEVLRKFYWTILGGRFSQLSHVSSPLWSKPWEYYSESDSEREGSEDEGPDFEEEGEEAVPEGQQQQHSS